MAVTPWEIASNTACTDVYGAYKARFMYVGIHGDLNEGFMYDADMGYELPERLRPAALFKWMSDRADGIRTRQRKPVIPRQRIVAASLVRTCVSREHIGLPRPAEDESLREELVGHVVVAKPGAKPKAILPPRPDHFSPLGIGAVRIPVEGEGYGTHGFNEPGAALLLPSYTRDRGNPGTDAVDMSQLTSAIQLNTNGRHPAYVVLQGFEQFVTPAQP